MHIQLRTFHQLRHLTDGLPADGRLELASRATVAEVLTRLGLDQDPPEGLIVFRNGRPAGRHTLLESGDRLTLMAPLAGG
jgi:sulfur carrier protein ThiS